MNWPTFAATTPLARLHIVALLDDTGRRYVGIVFGFSQGERNLYFPGPVVFN